MNNFLKTFFSLTVRRHNLKSLICCAVLSGIATVCINLYLVHKAGERAMISQTTATIETATSWTELKVLANSLDMEVLKENPELYRAITTKILDAQYLYLLNTVGANGFELLKYKYPNYDKHYTASDQLFVLSVFLQPKSIIGLTESYASATNKLKTETMQLLKNPLLRIEAKENVASMQVNEITSIAGKNVDNYVTKTSLPILLLQKLAQENQLSTELALAMH